MSLTRRDTEADGGSPPPPTEKDLIRVAIDELYGESKRWYSAADDMGDVVSKVKALTCDDAAFSFVDLDVGVAKQYEKTRSQLEKLARKAEDSFEYLGKALKTAAGEFEDDESRNKHRVENAVEWKE